MVKVHETGGHYITILPADWSTSTSLYLFPSNSYGENAMEPNLENPRSFLNVC